MFLSIRYLFRSFLTLFITILSIGQANAQIGLKLDYVHQNSLMGYYLKPSIMPTLLYRRELHEGKAFESLALGYTSQKPSLDVFHEYVTKTQTNGDMAVIPEDLRWKKSSLVYFYSDAGIRCLKVHRFRLYCGLGIIIGFNKYEYDLTRQTGVQNVQNTMAVAGLRTNMFFQYNVSDHIQAFAIANKNFMANSDGSFNSTSFGLGIYYLINASEWDYSDY